MSMDSFLSLFGPSADDDFTVGHNHNDDNNDEDDTLNNNNDYTLHDPFGHQGMLTSSSSSLSSCASITPPPPSTASASTSTTATTTPAAHTISQQPQPQRRSKHHHQPQHQHHKTNHNRSTARQEEEHANDSSNRTTTTSTTTTASACPLALNFERGRLPPEPQLGNIEYKLKLIAPTAQRFEHLVTQMKWRLREGNGEAIYEIGVSDSGHLHGLAAADMRASLHTLSRMAQELGATTTVLRRQPIDAMDATPAALTVAEVLVRKAPADQHSVEVRVAVLGSAGAGKSTLLGVLTQGERDNGRGRARLNMFRHMHEIRSGRTSCISHETLGFDQNGVVLNYAAPPQQQQQQQSATATGSGEPQYNDTQTTPAGCCDAVHLSSAERLSERSSKLVTFMDLAGHRRYMRTTVQALTGYGPHQAMLVIGAAAASATTAASAAAATAAATGDDDTHAMAVQHLGIVLALGMPFFVVVTKIDAVDPADTLLALAAMLTAAGCRRVPYAVRTDDDVLTAQARQLGGQVVPIFCVSNVTGAGLELLTRFLYVLPPGVSEAERARLERLPSVFHVDEMFKVAGAPRAGGPVIGGLLVQGVLAERQPMRLGPLPDGGFVAVRVRSMHRNKAPCRAVRAGQSASLALVLDERGAAGGEQQRCAVDLGRVVRSGMVLLSPEQALLPATDEGDEAPELQHDELEPYGSFFFQAKISVLFHATSIYVGVQTTVHIGSIRQTAVIAGIMGAQHIGTNDSASVLFRFVGHPEYVQCGQRVLFREGTSKGVGHVTQVFPLNKLPAAGGTAIG